MFNHVTRRLTFLRALAAAFVLLSLHGAGFGPRAHAQGTMGMLPSPISTVELDGYARRLRVSPQQRRALDAIHDQYKQEFRELRENEIAAFMRKMRDMDGGMMPSRRSIEEFISEMDRLTRRIASLDQRFFDQAQAALTDEQLAMMPRVRLARQRGRMQDMQMMWMGTERPTDLSEIAYAMEWPETERAAVIDMLGPYETSLTSGMEKMHDAAMRAITGMYDAIEKLGVTEDAAQDPEQMEKVGEAVQQVWQTMMKDLQERARDISELNDRTVRAVTASISSPAGRAFRYRYVQLTYPEVAFAMFPHDYVFEPALQRDDLTPQQREGVIAARDQLLQSLESTLNKAVESAQQWRSSVSMFEYDQQKAEAYQREMAELRAEAEKARSAANTALEAALGKELFEKIGKVRELSHPEEAALLANNDFSEMDEGDIAAEIEDPDEEDFDEVTMGVDQFVPPAISPADLNEYAIILGLDSDGRDVLNQLHARYLGEFEMLGESAFAELQKVTTSMWEWDDELQVSRGPTQAKVNDAYRLRAAAFEAVKGVDDRFFDEVELALTTAEQTTRMQRVRLARQRANYNRNAYYWDSNEGSIDLARLVRRQRTRVSDEQWKRIDEALHSYERNSLPMLSRRYQATLDMQKAQELWQVEMAAAQQAGDANNMRLGMRYQEMMREPQQTMAAASKELSELNRSALTELSNILATDAAAALRDEFNRRAFPNVYDDTGSMQKVIARARALPELTAAQQQQLTDIAAAYQPAYDAICEQMVEASVDRSMMFATMMEDEEEAAEWQKREETLAKLRFDRAELNARAAGQLRTVLTADQLKSLGGLPEVQRPSEFDF